ncbi:hypothetical protein Tco_1184822 [Tanacetum coccineum]
MVRKCMNEKKGDDAIKGRGDKGSHPLKSILKKTGYPIPIVNDSSMGSAGAAIAANITNANVSAPTGGVSSPNAAVNNSNMEDTPVRARRHVIMDPIVNIHEFMSQPGERDDSTSTTAASGIHIDNTCFNEAAPTPNVAATSPENIPHSKPVSFASILNSEQVNKKVNFRSFVNEERVENSDMVLPKATMESIKNRYVNSLVGYFVEGLDQVLQRGPWMIRMSPIILNKCSSGLSLKKGEVTRVSSRISFACALIEVSSESGLKSKVTMAISNEEGDGYTKEVIRVEYEWKPPHCGDCKIFGHDLLQCPKHVKEIVFNDPSKVGTSTSTDTSSDGFTEVTRKKNKGAQAHQKLSCKGQMGTNSSNNKGNGPSTSISFEVLNKVDVGDECGISSSMGTANEHTRSTWNEDFESDDEVDEVIFSKSNKWDDHFDIRLKGRVRK